MQFWRGFLAAILALELGALAFVFLRAAPAFVAMTKDFGGPALPPAFVLVTSTEYAIGCIAGLAVLAIAADRLARTPQSRTIALAIVATIGAAVLAFTLYGLYAPIFAVAGNIE